jgi:hypothetical protein
VLLESDNSKPSGSSKNKGLTREKLDEYRRIMKADQELPRERPKFEVSTGDRSNLDILNDMMHADDPELEDIVDHLLFKPWETDRMIRVAGMVRALARGVSDARIYRRFIVSNTRNTVSECLRAAKGLTFDHPKGFAELVEKEKKWKADK